MIHALHMDWSHFPISTTFQSCLPILNFLNIQSKGGIHFDLERTKKHPNLNKQLKCTIV